MSDMSKDEYVAMLIDLQERQQQAHQAMMAQVLERVSNLLREVNASITEEAPSPEQIEAQRAERLKHMRDAFASSIMQGILAGRTSWPETDEEVEQGAREAYRMADAMLKARDGSRGISGDEHG